MAANPTQALVEHCAANPALLGPEAFFALLDVDYRAAPGALDSLLDLSPAALVLTGYSHRATGVTLEACATGQCAPDKPDACGYAPDPLATALPRLDTRVDLPSILADLQAAGIPAVISHDAGQYLCNFSYRHALDQVVARGLPTPVLFVHLPAITDTPLAATSAASLPLEAMVDALRLVMARLLAG